MTLVHAETGEVLTDADVIEELDADAARALTDRINHSIDIAGALIIEAWEGRAWKSLGYSSWDDYTQAEIGAEQMTAAARAVLAVGLRQAGMSYRAIASATKSSKSTIERDLAGVPSRDTSTGTDGKSYPATQPERARSGDAGNREDPNGGDPVDPSPDPTTDPGDADDREAPDGSVTVPPSPGSATRDALDEIDPEGAAEADYLAYQTRLQGVIANVRGGLLSFDAETLAVRADEENWGRVEALVTDLADWFERALNSRPKPMRVINGGKS